MARRIRFHKPSAIYHVMLRGNDRQPIFLSDDDKSFICLLIQKGIQKFGHSIHAFCLMNNHIHLAIQVAEINISCIMQNIAFRYTRYFNFKYNRVGHLFQGRFKSIIVDGSTYLKELIRYIHLNPVRAKIVDLPEYYVWSSHRAYLMLDQFSWLTCSHVLKNFGMNRKEAINDYNQFILKGIGVESKLDFKLGSSKGILGDEQFVDNFLDFDIGTPKPEIKLEVLIKKICEHFDISENNLKSPGKHRKESRIRGILAYFVREINNLSIEELAAFLNRDSSGLSKLASRLEDKCRQLPELSQEIEEIRKSIYSNHSQMSECQA